MYRFTLVLMIVSIVAIAIFSVQAESDEAIRPYKAKCDSPSF